MYQRVNAHDTKSYSVLSGLLLEIVRVLVGSRMSVHGLRAVCAISAESSPAPAVFVVLHVSASSSVLAFGVVIA